MVLSAPPTVLWVLPVSDLGGVARHAADVARVEIPGYRVVFLVPDGPVVGVLRGAGAEVVVDRIGPAHGLAASLVALRRAQRRLRPAVVHSHLSYADVVASLGKQRGQRLVTTEHGIAADDLVYHRSTARSALKARLHRLRLRRTDGFVAVSHATLDAALTKWRLPPRLTTAVVPNGVDASSRSAAHAPGPHVVSLARLAPEKRLDRLLDGFALLAAEHPAARLTLAGTGPLEGDLRAQVSRLGLGDRVDLPGHVDAGPLLAEADVLAQLSVWENCSYAILDGLARGVGVVASPVGGNPELVPERCLVDPEDPTTVAAVLASQGLDRGTRPALPEGWPSVAAMTARIAAVYDGVLG
ncbi:glycosyl transferase [Marmoricola endophyticus]|uniref:Glycosyl transferase n=1 Tax=Marmoricola endophyticus TaxID=2040280 RepID=A0A917BQ11_9ACTN|nr:glycosyltransferase [Marmoricola endophyticus]GGF51706.1 glycosyl transferase [Marmoricola endophyticus]